MRQQPFLLSAILGLLFPCIGLPAPVLPEEDFGTAHALWNKMHEECRLKAESESILASTEKRPSRSPALYEAMYKSFLGQIADKPGALPFVHVATRAMLLNRITYADLGFKAEDMERELREIWKMVYKQEKTADYETLYNRYVSEKKYADAVRIAEECRKEYAWAWEVRKWDDWVIRSMSSDPAFSDPMVTEIVQFCKRWREEAGSHEYLLRYLTYLERAGQWKVADSVAEACIATYRDCDWEPQYLAMAMRALSHLLQPPPPAAGSAEASPAPDPDVSKRLLAVMTRAMQRCPYVPETSIEVLQVFRYTQGLKDDSSPVGKALAPLAAAYLAKYKRSPYWLEFWNAGAKLVQAGQAEWTALADEAKAETANRAERERKLNEILTAPAEPRLTLTQAALKCSAALAKFAEENPDTAQAQRALTTLMTKLRSSEWALEIIPCTPVIARGVTRGLPNNPTLRGARLLELGSTSLGPSTDIMNQLLAATSSSIQNEWYHYWNYRRFVSRGGYDISAFKKWAVRYAGSYLLPQELDGLCQQACYSQKIQDACRACDALSERRYGNSLIIARVYASNIGSWMHYTIAKETAREASEKAARAAKTAGKAGGKTGDKTPAPPPQPDEKLVRFYAKQAQEQANMIDVVQKDKVNLGYLYHHCVRWGDQVKFQAWQNMSAVDILCTGNYKDSFFFFYSGAYRKLRQP